MSNSTAPKTTRELIAILQQVEAEHGIVLVKIDGFSVTSTDVVPAEGGFPMYLDIVGR